MIIGFFKRPLRAKLISPLCKWYYRLSYGKIFAKWGEMSHSSHCIVLVFNLKCQL